MGKADFEPTVLFKAEGSALREKEPGAADLRMAPWRTDSRSLGPLAFLAE